MTKEDGDASLIIVDWGTTNLRTVLVSQVGEIIEQNTYKAGLLSSAGNFDQILNDRIGCWLGQFGDLDVMMSGMIGSRTGWTEVPYVSCPISAQSLAGGLACIDNFNSGRCWIIPGVSGTSVSGEADVMRGEEVQVVGALNLLGRRGTKLPDALCLPGTHSKWIELSQGAAVGFSTAMTGEIFDVLSQHSILAQSLEQGDLHIWQAFNEGLEASTTGGGMSHQLFAVRTRHLLGSQHHECGASFLSGILIGNELQEMLFAGNSPANVCVIGSPYLTKLYARAFDFFEIESFALASDEATLAGHRQVALAAGILPTG